MSWVTHSYERRGRSSLSDLARSAMLISIKVLDIRHRDMT